MAFEILNNAQVTPHRLHALVKVVARFPGLERQAVLDLVAPKEIDDDQAAAKAVFNAAERMRLIIPTPEGGTGLISAVGTADLASVDGFRGHMRNIVLNVTNDSSNNFLFNQYAAWYAVQDDAVLRMDRDDYHSQFNAQMHMDSEERAFNSTKRNGWETWAAFVGLGWPLALTGNQRAIFVPDARERVAALLPEVLTDYEQEVPFREFATQLAERCPELDGGVLFEHAWAASRPGGRGNQLSLMLSNALQGLHAHKRITLRLVPDAGDVWALFPAGGFELQRVSHIRMGVPT